MLHSDSGVAAADVDAGGWVFGGVTQVNDQQQGFRSLGEQVVLTALKDLWHWNGDLGKPAWTLKTATSSLWPPAWQAPQGWASDSDGGELWLVGDSGKVHELSYTAETFAEQVRTSFLCLTMAKPFHMASQRRRR